MGYYSQQQLESMGFKELGRGVKLSEKTSIYNPGAIALGDWCRIDDFSILSAGQGGIAIGRNVHVACFCSLIGRESIVLEDFSGLSSRVAIYSSSDDYSGLSLTNPTVPERFRNIDHGRVRIGRHAILGAGAVVLPRVTIGEGAAIASLALVMKDCEPFSVYMGAPARRVGARQNGLLEREREYLQAEREGNS